MALFKRYSPERTSNFEGDSHFGLDGYVGSSIQSIADNLPFGVQTSGNLTIDQVNAMDGHKQHLKEQAKFWQRYSKDAAAALEAYQEVRKHQAATSHAVLEARDVVAKIDAKLGEAYNKSEGQYAKIAAEYEQAMQLQMAQNQHWIEMAKKRGANDRQLQRQRFNQDRAMENERYSGGRSRLTQTFNERLKSMRHGQSQVFAPIKSKMAL